MSEIAQIISQLGFPIFVAVWMLYKTSKDSEALKDTIADLKNNTDKDLNNYISPINNTVK